MTDGSDSRDDIGRLIRSAGRGPSASGDARARVYSAANAAWRRSVPARRGRRRPLPWLAAVAGLAAVVVAAVVVIPEPPTPPQGRPALASFNRVDGPVELVSAGQGRRVWPDSTDVSIRLADLVRTGADAGAAIDLQSGLVLRVNEQSAVRFASPELLALERGVLYVDTGSNGTAATLEVATALGRVTHLGTQYEVGVDGRAVRLRVREGEVVFRDEGREVTAEAGEQVSILATGAPVRTALAPHDPAWNWVEALAVLRRGNDASVSELLAWAARETGVALRYADRATESDAARLTLHGIEGLTPAEVLDVIDGTTSVRHIERDGELLVSTEP